MQPDVVPRAEHEQEAEDHRGKLTGDGRVRGARHAEPREAEQAEDQDRVEHDVDQRAGDLHEHDEHGLALRLHDALRAHLQKDAEREHAADGQVVHAHIADERRFRHERIEKRPDAEQTEQQEHHRRDEQQKQAVARGGVGVLKAALAQPARDQRVHADARSHGNGDHEHLNRERERYGRERVLAQPGDKDAVDDVVERLREHGDHDRQRHAEQQPALGHIAHFVFRSILFHREIDYHISSGMARFLTYMPRLSAYRTV